MIGALKQLQAGSMPGRQERGMDVSQAQEAKQLRDQNTKRRLELVAQKADFLHDAVESGRAIREQSVLDAYTRECLALEVDTSFSSRRVTRVLDAIAAERGQPLAIRCDNGPELTSRHYMAWCVERPIELVSIQPGKPT
jgi:transposase InsO family protein